MRYNNFVKMIRKGDAIGNSYVFQGSPSFMREHFVFSMRFKGTNRAELAL